jgi:hypothetical protein
MPARRNGCGNASEKPSCSDYILTGPKAQKAARELTLNIRLDAGFAGSAPFIYLTFAAAFYQSQEIKYWLGFSKEMRISISSSRSRHHRSMPRSP